MSAAKSSRSFLLLESLPQFPPRPARFNTNAGSRATRTAPYISCVKGAKRSPDDYRATLKSLNSRGRVPRESLALHVEQWLNVRLVGAASVRDGDVVLEIGPGTGSLTNVLSILALLFLPSKGLFLGVVGCLSCLIDALNPYMAAIANERFSGTNRLQVLREDFVRCHIHSHLSALLVKSNVKSAKVVSNIPFNISTDVIKQILPLGDIVDAAVVTFKLKQAANYPAVSSVKSFFSLVNSAFDGKRKMLQKSLQHLCRAYEIEKALEDIGLPASVCAVAAILASTTFVSLVCCSQDPRSSQ